ncbi:MAG: ribokinase [Myxococcota bacterium]
MRDILVVGSVNVDISVRAERIPQPGETVRADELELLAGGKGLNQAIGARRLGGRVRMIGRLGDDRLAEIPEHALDEARVETSHVRRVAGSKTGTALIVVDGHGQNAIAVAGGANRTLMPEDLRGALAAFRASGVLLVQLELRLETVETALELARENSVKTILDPAPARSLPDPLLRRVDVLTPNESEAERLTGVAVRDVESAALAGRRLQERTLGDVVVTLGPRGCVWVWATGFEHVPTPAVRPVDTTAAGDAFNAALAIELARGKPVGASLELALRAASASTLRRGAAPSLPRADEIDARLEESEL